jgi:chromosomal replication initiation ATPase DnaA
MNTYHDNLVAARRQRLARLSGAEVASGGGGEGKPMAERGACEEITALQMRLTQLETRVEALLRRRRRSERATQVVAAADPTHDSMTTDLKQALCRDHHVTRRELEGPSLTDQLTEARRIGMYLVRRLTGCSFSRAGRQFGRSHSAALKAHRVVSRQRTTDAELDRRLAALESPVTQTK